MILTSFRSWNRRDTRGARTRATLQLRNPLLREHPRLDSILSTATRRFVAALVSIHCVVLVVLNILTTTLTPFAAFAVAGDDGGVDAY